MYRYSSFWGAKQQFLERENLMKNKKGNVTRRIVALLSGVVLSGQLATAATPILAHAEGVTQAEQICTVIAEGGSGGVGGGAAVTPTTNGTIVAGFELPIASTNPYYQKLMKTVDSLVKVRQVSNGKKYTQWSTVCPFTNKSTNTDLTISINMDLRDIARYSSEDEMVKNAVFHITGTHRGKKVDRYIAYCDALKNLRNQLLQAKQAQIKTYLQTSKTLYGDCILRLGDGQMVVWTEELGRINLRTTSKLDVSYYVSNVPVKLTNIKVLTLSTSDPYTNISCKVTVVK